MQALPRATARRSAPSGRQRARPAKNRASMAMRSSRHDRFRRRMIRGWLPSLRLGLSAGVLLDRLPERGQLLEVPGIVQAIVDRLLGEVGHLLEMRSEPRLFFDIEQEGMLHPFQEGVGRVEALECNALGTSVPQKINPSQRSGLVAEHELLASQKPRLGGVLQGWSATHAWRHERIPAVLPQANRRMTGHDFETAGGRLHQEAIVGQQPKAAGGEAGRKRGLASAGLGDKGNRTLGDLDATCMKDQLAALAQDQRPNLAQVEMFNGRLGSIGGGKADKIVPRGGDLEIRQLRKAQQVTAVEAIEMEPGRSVAGGPGMEGNDLHLCLAAPRTDAKIGHYAVPRPTTCATKWERKRGCLFSTACSISCAVRRTCADPSLLRFGIRSGCER